MEYVCYLAYQTRTAPLATLFRSLDLMWVIFWYARSIALPWTLYIQIYRRILDLPESDPYLYEPRMGLLLSDELHHAFDRYEWSLWYNVGCIISPESQSDILSRSRKTRASSCTTSAPTPSQNETYTGKQSLSHISVGHRIGDLISVCWNGIILNALRHTFAALSSRARNIFVGSLNFDIQGVK